MTTSNSIVTNSIDNTLFIEKAAIRGTDSLRYVIMKDGLSVVKKEIKVGIENEEFFEITKGLNENDKVLMAAPENEAVLEVVRL
jgi:hypothetical protein